MKKHNEILTIIKERFENNIERHPNISWSDIEDSILKNNNVLDIIIKLENDGGEPDVISFPNGKIAFVDMVKESPNRRSFCYDEDARIKRKKFPPENSAWGYARALGARLINEEEYIYIQSLDDLDLKSSSWIDTPDYIRNLGGALFGDKRYKRAFIYHNGADSYYSSRGFRLCVDIIK